MGSSQIVTSRHSPYVIRMVIWSAMVTALLTYAIMAYVAAVAPDDGPRPIVGPLAILRNIICGLALVCFVLGLVLPWLAGKKGVPDRQRKFWIFVFQLCLHEAVALLGFMVTFLSWHGEYSVIAGGAGLFGMALIFPRRNQV